VSFRGRIHLFFFTKQASKGEYVWFVDSDDYIQNNCINNLLRVSNENKLDILAFNIATVSEKGDLLSQENAFTDVISTTKGIDFLNNTFGKSIIFNLGYPFRAIYRRGLLKQINANFPTEISYGEETIFMARCILWADRVMSISDSYYFYRQNPLSVTASLEKSFRGHLLFQSIFCAGNLILDLIDESKKKDAILSENILFGMPWFVNRLFIRLLRTPMNERINFYKELKKNDTVINNLLEFMNNRNYFVTKHSLLGFILVSLIAPFYKIKKKLI